MGVATFVHVDNKGRYSADLPLDRWLTAYGHEDRDQGQTFLRCPNHVRHAMIMHRVWGQLIRSTCPAIKLLAAARLNISPLNFYYFQTNVSHQPYEENWLRYEWHDSSHHSMVDRLLQNAFCYVPQGWGGTWTCPTYGNTVRHSRPVVKSSNSRTKRGLHCADLGNMGEYSYDRAVEEGLMVRAQPKLRNEVGHVIAALFQPWGVTESREPVLKCAMSVERPRSAVTRAMMPLAQAHQWETLVAQLPKAIGDALAGQAWRGSPSLEDEIGWFMESREQYGMWCLEQRKPITESLALWDSTAMHDYYHVSEAGRVYCPDFSPKPIFGDRPGLLGETAAQGLAKATCSIANNPQKAR